MTLSKETLGILKPLIRKFEGCKLVAYPDPATGGDPWTIGYGQTGQGIKKGTVWSQAQADSALSDSLQNFYDGALKFSPGLSKASPSRQAAIISFCYNCGLANYAKSSLLKDVLVENWVLAAKDITKWNKANGKVMRGLTLRRLEESKLLR